MFSNFTAFANVLLAAIPICALGFAALTDVAKMI